MKAAPEEVSEEDYAGYLFVHFTGSEGSSNDEQTYFSLSKDGLNWEDLNGNKPVLKSTFEMCIRDSHHSRWSVSTWNQKVSADRDRKGNGCGLLCKQFSSDRTERRNETGCPKRRELQCAAQGSAGSVSVTDLSLIHI